MAGRRGCFRVVPSAISSDLLRKPHTSAHAGAGPSVKGDGALPAWTADYRRGADPGADRDSSDEHGEYPSQAAEVLGRMRFRPRHRVVRLDGFHLPLCITTWPPGEAVSVHFPTI